MAQVSFLENYMISDELVYIGCACECFIKITGRNFAWDDDGRPDRMISVEYGSMTSSQYIWRAKWRSRIKRAWKSLRNQDSYPGFEFYDEEHALKFAESYARAVFATFPPEITEMPSDEYL